MNGVDGTTAAKQVINNDKENVISHLLIKIGSVKLMIVLDHLRNQDIMKKNAVVRPLITGFPEKSLHVEDTNLTSLDFQSISPFNPPFSPNLLGISIGILTDFSGKAFHDNSSFD